MGEEQKEEEKKEEVKEEKKEVEVEIVLRVDMHCEGCAKKVAKALRGFEGVEEMKIDTKARLVIVKGKTADPIKIYKRVQTKTGRRTELISPISKEPEEEKKKDAVDPPQEEKKEEPKPITVILNVRMHCESCAQVLHKRIKKMEGVESVMTDVSNNQIIVNGFIDPEKLVDYVSKRTRKQAFIVKEEEKKDDEKAEDEEKKEEKENEEKITEDDERKIELQKFEHWSSPGYDIQYSYPPPQIFSDENPNACFVM
ncbi:putative heavy metal-associated isoprenylated plant protein/8/17/18/19 [Dioscorea sansibarensis]